MKRLIPFLLVIVYLNNGQVLKYPTATVAYTGGGSFFANDDRLYLYDKDAGFVAELMLSSVSRWEVGERK